MEIKTEPTFQHVTWIIADFFDLPQENEFFLDSPAFHFHGDRYGIRLYPNIQNEDKTSFHLRRLTLNFSEIKVSCRSGLRTRESNGDERYRYSWWSLDGSGFFSRYRIEEKRDEFVPDGSLTVVYCMWLSEVSRALSSTEEEAEQGGFPGRNASLSSRRSPAKVELRTESPCTHVELTVRKVFQLLRETGDTLTSPEFRFAGDAYCFRLEANGITGDTELQLVRLTSTFTENDVYYRVGYGGSSDPAYPKYTRLVSKVGICVSRSKLKEERDKYARYGDLRLVLFLRLGEENIAGTATSNATQKRTLLPGISKLRSDYSQMLRKGTESDACVVVRGKEFPVHRVVLRARSTVFDAMFDHDTAEKESGRVVVDDLDPDTFGDFLTYLYTGVVQEELSDDNAFGLYAAADKYDLYTLKWRCVEHMRQTLSVDSFSDVVTLALRHREENLLQHAITFFKDNLHLIFISEKWQQFNIDNGASVNQFLSKAYSSGTQ